MIAALRDQDKARSAICGAGSLRPLVLAFLLLLAKGYFPPLNDGSSPSFFLTALSAVDIAAKFTPALSKSRRMKSSIRARTLSVPISWAGSSAFVLI
jgi:hypothetical protein